MTRRCGKEVLCILTNPANYDEVMRVVPAAQQIDTSVDLAALTMQVDMSSGLHLGELQSNYAELFQAVQDYRFFLNHNVYGNTVATCSSKRCTTIC